MNFISTLIKYASPNVCSLNLWDFDKKKAHLSVAQITCNKAVYDYKFHKSVSIMLVKLIVDRKNENNELPSIYI